MNAPQAGNVNWQTIYVKWDLLDDGLTGVDTFTITIQERTSKGRGSVLSIIYSTFQLISYNHSTVKPLNTADLETGEKAAVFRKRRYWESYITYKTLIWDFKMGRGIGRVAVLGGAVLRGMTVYRSLGTR